MTNTYANTVDEDFEQSWVRLGAAAGNVLAFLRQRRATAADAPDNGEASTAVIPDAGGQAPEHD